MSRIREETFADDIIDRSNYKKEVDLCWACDSVTAQVDH